MSGFEGSFGGDAARIAKDAKLECGICWHVYDPAAGDEAARIAEGTPFAALPEAWRCPVCDAEKDKFMVLDAGRAAGGEAEAAETLARRVRQLERAFEARDAAMRDLPVHNGLLRVEAVGFRTFGAEMAGVLITPWFMNLIAAPLDPAGGASIVEGVSRPRAFPSGVYPMIGGRLDRFGPYEMGSLFSPMFEFDDQAVARMAAQAAADALFEPDPETAPAPPRAASRRELFTGLRG